MKSPIVCGLLLLAMLSACAPTDKAASAKPAFEIAKDARADLDKAKAVAAEQEKAAADAKQKIDEQTQ